MAQTGEDMRADGDFYRNLPLFRSFAKLMEPALYTPLPNGWMIGVADIVDSTKAIAAKRYKAVNMAGAAVIAALTNALDGRDFPFVFGGDGASFAVPAADAVLAREALAATSGWVGRDLDLVMRVALVPIEAIRGAGWDVRVARYAPSPFVAYAMFSGGGLAYAEAAMKRGEFAVAAVPEGLPDLSGLSCRFSEIPARRGVILSLLVVPGRNGAAEDYRRTIEEIIRLIERSPEAGRPVAPEGPPLGWPPQGLELEARADRRGPLLLRRARLLGFTLFAYLIMRFDLKVGGFSPADYRRQLVANSDFRKYDDALRMVIDCTPDLADELRRQLETAAAAGSVRFGLHRQDAAMMTCFTPSALRNDHVHFIDGARGGYASAAVALKAVAPSAGP